MSAVYFLRLVDTLTSDVFRHECEDENGGAVHRAIHSIIHLIDDHARAAGISMTGHLDEKLEQVLRAMKERLAKEKE